jgi:glycosyltransferase involved in cell wall biosynthesis
VRVLFVNHGALIGGAETNLLNILRFAAVGGFEPVGLLMPFDGPLASRARGLNIRVGQIDYFKFSWRNPARYSHTLCNLVAWIIRTRPSVIHLNHQWLISHIVQAGIITGIPVVCHTRNYLDEDFVNLQRRWLNKSQALIVESQAVWHRAHLLGLPHDRIFLVHNGIDPSRFSVNEFDVGVGDTTKQRDRPVIGFSGRIVPEKGPEDLIRAIPHVHTRSPTATFLFLGTDQEGGAYIQHLRNIAGQLGVQDYVQFVGFQDKPESFLSHLDVLVAPSRSTMPEGLPLTVLEGLAAGCLIVATPNSGIPELVHNGETGFLVPFDNIPSLAHGILSALELPQQEQQKIRCASRSLVESQFDIRGQVAKLGRIYRDLTEIDKGQKH